MTNLILPTLAALGLGLLPMAASAAIVTESYSFDATVAEGDIQCGYLVGEFDPCPELFGQTGDDSTPIEGMTVGGTYAARLEFTYDIADDGTVDINDATVNCVINGGDCAWEDGYAEWTPPLGASPGTIGFNDLWQSQSWSFAILGVAGTASFTSDYLEAADGRTYLYDVSFDLSKVQYTGPGIDPAPIPLPAGLPLLLSAVMVGFGGVVAKRRAKG